MHYVFAAFFVIAASFASAAETAASTAEGAEPPTVVTGDIIEYDSRRELVIVRGNAAVERGGQRVDADWIAYSERTGRGVARGNVRVDDGVDMLESEFMDLDFDTFHGVVLDGNYDSRAGGFRASGSQIERTGPDAYRFDDGRFTTCRCPEDEPGEAPDGEAQVTAAEGEAEGDKGLCSRDPWAVRAEEASFEVEGYGTAKNATVEVFGVPVFWTPFLLYPVKTKRQSGLLLPQIGISARSGVDLGFPIFLALRDNVNLTLTPHWLEKRGFKGDAELEYLLGERSDGDLFTSFVNDDEVKEQSFSEPFDKERWAVKGRNRFFLPFDVDARTDFQFVSDNQFPIDFEELSRARVDRFLESTFFLARDFGASGAFGLTGQATPRDDLQAPDDLDRDDFLLRRLPQFDGVALAAPLAAPLPWASRLVPAMDFRYTFFNRAESAIANRPTGTVVGNRLFIDTGIDGTPDAQERGPAGGAIPSPPGTDPNSDNFGSVFRGTEGDGRFQEGEPLADEGHRTLLRPRLGVPLRVLDLFELYPEVGWVQTLFGSDAQGFEERGLFTARADLRTRLRRRFDVAGGLTHVLEPRLGWAFVSDRSQGNDPLFVPATAVPQERVRQLELDNVTLDPADRIRERNSLTFGFGNRLYGGEGGNTLIADFALSAEYDFEDDEFGVIYLDGRARPLPQLGIWTILGFDPDRGRMDEALFNVDWTSRRGDRFGLSYRYLRKVGRFFEDYDFARERFDNFSGEFDRVNQIGGSAKLVLTDRWAVTYRGGFSFENQILIANLGGVEYTDRCNCWSIGVEVSQDRVRGAAVGISFSLSGFGRDDVERGRQRRQRAGVGLLDAF